MKVKHLLIASLYILFTVTNCHAEKYALIVAIAKYPNPYKNGWMPLSSDKDAVLVKDALLQKQFAEKNILMIQDSMADKKGIENAFSTLIHKVKKDDVVVIHFSSHGEQLADDNNDELDGLDEAIVPYGAVYPENPNDFYKYEKAYLRDDEFGLYIDSLRTRMGSNGDLLVMLDACHSGTGTRGIAVCRGGKPAMVPAGFTNNSRGHAGDGDNFADNFSRVVSGKATYSVISAAKAEQLNFECSDDKGNSVGSLSYAFAKALSNSTPNTSYKGLYDNIVSVMNVKASRQEPVMEGDGAQRSLLGGTVQKVPSHLNIVGSPGPGKIELNSGTIAGTNVGSKFDVYKVDAIIGKDVKIDEGQIVAANSFTSTGSLKSGKTYNKGEAWIVMTALSYGDGVVRIKVEDNPVVANIKKNLEGFSLVQLSPNPELILAKDSVSGNWQLRYANNGSVFLDKVNVNSASGAEDVQIAVKRFAQYRFIQQMLSNEEGLNVKVDLVPGTKAQPDTSAMLAKSRGGLMEFAEGENMWIRITNEGPVPAYVNILDLQPDGVVNPLLPNRSLNVSPDELKFAPGTSQIIKYPITISPPYGREMLKVFVTRKAINLEDVAVTKGATSRGIMEGLEKVFQQSYTMSRGVSLSVDQDGTVFNIPFNIVPKK